MNMQSFCFALVKSRRRTDRRTTIAIAHTYYTDWYGPYTYAAALVMMLLCIADAAFTLILIEHGAQELNPFAAMLLENGVMWFFAIKYLLTTLCVVVVVMHKRFDIFGLRGYHLLLGCIAGYLVLINYQVAMLLSLP